MSIPTFPQFKALELNNQEAIEVLTKQFLPYSDHHFAGMWCWDTANQIQVSQLNNNIIFVLHDYLTNEEFYSFIGLTRLDDTIERLLVHSKKAGYDQKIRLIPEAIAREVDKRKYVVEADRDNYDYILSVSDALNLDIQKNKSTRKNVHLFEKLYGDKTSIRLLNLEEKSTIGAIFNMFELWAKKKLISQEEIDPERTALTRFLQVLPRIVVQTIGLYVDESLIGFSVDEIVDRDYAMGHFQKADVEYKGAYQYLDYVVNLELDKKRIKYINIEQDLGLENLRTTKLGHHPYDMWKKYSISRRQL